MEVAWENALRACSMQETGFDENAWSLVSDEYVPRNPWTTEELHQCT